MKKIGFIGTGIMGSAMVGHLMDAGYELTLYNRTKSKAESLLARGAKWADTPAECAKGQDVVMTIVGYPKDVEEIYLNDDGILEAADKETYVVDMTTSSPSLAQEIYEVAKEKGVYAVDSPVTGGEVGAINGTLTVLVGGDEEAYEALKPVFSTFASRVIHEGSAGSGQKTKACNQIAIAGTLMGVCEAFAYAKSAGLDPQKVFDSISEGAASSFQMKTVVKAGLDGNFQPGFMLKHLIKDLKISLDTAAYFGLELPIAEVSLDMAQTLAERGYGNRGTQIMLKADRHIH